MVKAIEVINYVNFLLAVEDRQTPRYCGKHLRPILCHSVSFSIQVWLNTHAFLVTTYKIS